MALHTQHNPEETERLARARARAILAVSILAAAAVLLVYYLAFWNSPPPPSPQVLSESDKLEILTELGKSNVSPLGTEERQKILDQIVAGSPKK